MHFASEDAMVRNSIQVYSSKTKCAKTEHGKDVNSVCAKCMHEGHRHGHQTNSFLCLRKRHTTSLSSPRPKRKNNTACAKPPPTPWALADPLATCSLLSWSTSAPQSATSLSPLSLSPADQLCGPFVLLVRTGLPGQRVMHEGDGFVLLSCAMWR